MGGDKQTQANVVHCCDIGFIFCHNVSQSAKIVLADSVLVPGEGETPDFPPLNEDASKEVKEAAFYLFLGTNVACIKDFPYTVVQHKDKPVLFLEKDGESLFLRNLFNHECKIICEILKIQGPHSRRPLARIEFDR